MIESLQHTEALWTATALALPVLTSVIVKFGHDVKVLSAEITGKHEPNEEVLDITSIENGKTITVPDKRQAEIIFKRPNDRYPQTMNIVSTTGGDGYNYNWTNTVQIGSYRPDIIPTYTEPLSILDGVEVQVR